METKSAESKLGNLTDNGPSIQAHAHTAARYSARQSNTIQYSMVLCGVTQCNTTVMSLWGNSVVLFRTRETIA